MLLTNAKRLFLKSATQLCKYALCLLIFISTATYCQDKQDDVISGSKLYQSINKKVLSLQRRLEEKSIKTLQRLQKQEGKLQKKLALKDSIAAKNLFTENGYQKLATELQHPASVKQVKSYIPAFDSLKTSLKFLESSKDIKSKLPIGFADKIKNVNLNVAGLETKMQQAEEIKNYIKQRKQFLKEQLEKYGMLKEMKGLSKEAYYYQQQLNEYKAVLKDRKKIEERALTELKKLPAFNDFLKSNSMLSQLFPTPDNPVTPASLQGFQTRSGMQNQLQQRMGSSAGSMQQIQGQMQQAQGSMNELRDKLKQAGNTGGDMDMPDFKPNSQKTKTFLNRLEYGANVQTQRPNGFLPVTSDVALTVGYKLNDQAVVGVGASYKMGWGNGFNSIKISSQGVGLRTYLDYKLKAKFWITGGYEKNYQHEFSKLDMLKDLNNWQSSGLIGITKKYKLGKKTNNLQVLWDFLSYKQVPATQPFVFRVGFGL